MLPSSLVRTTTLRRSRGAEYTTGIDGASNEARRRTTCASILLHITVADTVAIIIRRMANLTHLRGRYGGGGSIARVAVTFGFDLARRGPFEGAFLAFLTGMM